MKVLVLCLFAAAAVIAAAVAVRLVKLVVIKWRRFVRGFR